MIRLAILISGRGSNLLSLDDAIKRFNINAKIAVVISNKDCKGIILAKKRGLQTKICKRSDFDRQVDQETEIACIVRSYKADYIFLAGYMAILSGKFVDQFFGQIINIHPSLLPAFRGLDTHRRAIDSGELIHGVSVHLVTKTLDDGPIILQGRLPIRPDDNADSLAARTLKLEHQIYPFILFCLCECFLNLSANGVFWKTQSIALAKAPKSIHTSLAKKLIWPE